MTIGMHTLQLATTLVVEKRLEAERPRRWKIKPGRRHFRPGDPGAGARQPPRRPGRSAASPGLSRGGSSAETSASSNRRNRPCGAGSGF